MSYTIKAQDITPGMTITEESAGVARTLTVHTVKRKDNWVDLRTEKGGIACIRPNTMVEVEGEPPMSSLPVGTVLNVPGVGAVVRVHENGVYQWLDVVMGGGVTAANVDAWDDVTVVYTPERGEDVQRAPEAKEDSPRVPDVVKEFDEWDASNIEWRNHKWEDADHDVWEWSWEKYRWVSYGRGAINYITGTEMNGARFPLTRVN